MIKFVVYSHPGLNNPTLMFKETAASKRISNVHTEYVVGDKCDPAQVNKADIVHWPKWVFAGDIFYRKLG